MSEISSPAAELSNPVIRWGRFASYLLHPLLVGTPVALWVGIQQFGGVDIKLLQLIGLVGFLGLLFPLGSLWLLQRAGKISDFFITKREERRWLYPVGIANLLIIYGLFYAYGAPPAVLATVAASIVAAAMMGVANAFIKASLHCAGNAGIALALCWVEGWRLWPFWILVVVTIWARRAAREHTWPEIGVGLLLGVIPTGVCMSFFLGNATW